MLNIMCGLLTQTVAFQVNNAIMPLHLDAPDWITQPTVLNLQPTCEVPKEVIVFLNTHYAQIETRQEGYSNNSPLCVEEWNVLGSGELKTAYGHKALPGWVIKMKTTAETTLPEWLINEWLSKINRTREDFDREHLISSHNDIEKCRKTALQLDRIVIPESHLFRTRNGLIQVVQRLDLISMGWERTAEEEEVYTQFEVFKQKTKLTDLLPQIGHNSGVLRDIYPLKLGVIDCDG